MDFSGLFAAISVVGVAWVTAYFALRQKQEEEKGRARADYEKYRTERLQESDRLVLNPIREEIMLLEEFMSAVQRTHLVYVSEELFSDVEKKEVELSLARTSTKIYRYGDLKSKFALFMKNIHYTTDEYRESLLDAVETVLSEKRSEHAKVLRDSYDQDKPKQMAAEGGPLVRFASWIEKKLRDMLRLG